MGSRPIADTAHVRLFFALWPDAAARAHLGRWAADLHRSCGGRRTRDEQLHVTLAFLGKVPLGQLPMVRALAGRLTVPAFTLDFDAPGYWPRKRLVWAAPGRIPESLATLARELAEGLRGAGLEIEARSYFPHVTLVRDAGQPAAAPGGRFSWEVRDFVLVESQLGPGGSRYRVVGRWPLTPHQSASPDDDAMANTETEGRCGGEKSCGKR
ncbi:MAG: RNA 2',3'-cyclic phosphodiesterase [Burkholderiales bacterium]